jgi:hypothetical protein
LIINLQNTLRKRNKKLIGENLSIDDENWTKVRLDIPKRKYKKVSVYEQNVKLSDCKMNSDK